MIVASIRTASAVPTPTCSMKMISEVAKAPMATVNRTGVEPVAEGNGEAMCQLYAAYGRTNSDSKPAVRCGLPK